MYGRGIPLVKIYYLHCLLYIIVDFIDNPVIVQCIDSTFVQHVLCLTMNGQHQVLRLDT